MTESYYTTGLIIVINKEGSSCVSALIEFEKEKWASQEINSHAQGLIINGRIRLRAACSSKSLLMLEICFNVHLEKKKSKFICILMRSSCPVLRVLYRLFH